MVTKVDIHPGTSQKGEYGNIMDNLFLTSSQDWTVKLWNANNTEEPIFTFESGEDAIYDVQWSPVHPCIFACVDEEGHIDIWDIQKRDGPL